MFAPAEMPVHSGAWTGFPHRLTFSPGAEQFTATVEMISLAANSVQQ